VQDDSSEPISNRRIVGQVSVARGKRRLMRCCFSKREEPEVRQYCPEHPEETGDPTNTLGILTDITAKRHGGTETPLTTVEGEVFGGERDSDGKNIVNPYHQRRAPDDWNTTNETVKSTACIPFVLGLYIPLHLGILLFSFSRSLWSVKTSANGGVC
jgi:hypothetical protein